MADSKHGSQSWSLLKSRSYPIAEIGTDEHTRRKVTWQKKRRLKETFTNGGGKHGSACSSTGVSTRCRLESGRAKRFQASVNGSCTELKFR